MRNLILIALALSLCSCGVAVRQDAPATPAIHLPDFRDQTITQLQDRIKADQADITDAKAEITAKQEAKWALLAYITAGILGLGVLVFAFLAFEAPLLRGKLATAALFSGVAAIVCVYVGQHIHAILLSGPFIIAAGILGTIWVMRHKDKAKTDADNLTTFVASQWKKYGEDMAGRLPEAKAFLDGESLKAQHNVPGLKDAVDGVLAKL